MRSTLLAALPLCLVAACGGSSSSGSGSGSSADVAVESGDSTCKVATTQLAAGKHTFDVKNVGKDTTEVYVYAKGSDGKFDKVIGEVENISPQTSRAFPVTLAGGEYEVACKPGQKGEGIRTALTVSGEQAKAAETSGAAYDREVEVTAKEFSFSGLDGFTAKVGEKIEFKLKNDGATTHELEIFTPDGKVLGEVGPTDPGKNGEVVLELKVPGTYRYLCGIADHKSKGMAGTFTVA